MCAINDMVLCILYIPHEHDMYTLYSTYGQIYRYAARWVHSNNHNSRCYGASELFDRFLYPMLMRLWHPLTSLAMGQCDNEHGTAYPNKSSVLKADSHTLVLGECGLCKYLYIEINMRIMDATISAYFPAMTTIIFYWVFILVRMITTTMSKIMDLYVYVRMSLVRWHVLIWDERKMTKYI